MRFIGVDPSTKTGLVILSEDGQVLTEEEITTKEKEDPKRFMDLAASVRKHVQETDLICIEGFSYGSKGKGVSTQYGIGWMIRAELVRNGFSYKEISPSALKKFATGKGNCKKDELVLPIYKRWGYENPSDNIRDAYVLAQIGRALAGECETTSFQKDVMKKVSG